MIKKILLAFLLFFAMNAKAQSCKELPDKFHHSAKAIKDIRNAEFNFTDEIPEGSSSALIKVEYFSCDGNFGYFIFTNETGNEYVHENVPKSIWLEFKETDKKSSFYENSIRKKYNLIPK